MSRTGLTKIVTLTPKYVIINNTEVSDIHIFSFGCNTPRSKLYPSKILKRRRRPKKNARRKMMTRTCCRIPGSWWICPRWPTTRRSMGPWLWSACMPSNLQISGLSFQRMFFSGSGLWFLVIGKMVMRAKLARGPENKPVCHCPPKDVSCSRSCPVHPS